MLKNKKKEKYVTKVTSISAGYGNAYEEKLKRFKKEIKEKGGHIKGIVTISSIVIYEEKVEVNI